MALYVTNIGESFTQRGDELKIKIDHIKLTFIGAAQY